MDVKYLGEEFKKVLTENELDIKTGEDIIYAEQVLSHGYGFPTGIFKKNCQKHYNVLEAAKYLKMRQELDSDQTGMNDFRRSIVQERLSSKKRDLRDFLRTQPKEKIYIVLFGTLGDFYLYGSNYEFLSISNNVISSALTSPSAVTTLYRVHSELLCCGKLQHIPNITDEGHRILSLVCQYAPKAVVSFFKEFEKLRLGVSFTQHNTSNNPSIRHPIPLYELLLDEDMISFEQRPKIEKDVNRLLLWDLISKNPELDRLVFSRTWAKPSDLVPLIDITEKAGLTSKMLPEFSDKIAAVNNVQGLRVFCSERASEIAYRLFS